MQCLLPLTGRPVRALDTQRPGRGAFQAVDFIKFWSGVLWDSLWYIVTCSSVWGAVELVERILVHLGKPRTRWLMRLFSRIPRSVRWRILLVALAGLILWAAPAKWAIEVARADRAEQALASVTRQQFGRFDIGYSAPFSFHRFDSVEWEALRTPPVPYDWSTVPPDADVFATLYLRMRGGPGNRRNCRAARVRVRDLGTDTVSGESERIPYIPSTDQEEAIRLRLDRRTMLTRYALEVESETTECAVNVQGEIGAEYR